MANFQNKIDWDAVRKAANDCLDASWSLVCFAEWSQVASYDENRTAMHLEAIENARVTFRLAIEILQPGLESATDDSIRYSPIFDALVLAKAAWSDQTGFRYGPVCCATAHEACV